MDSGRLDTRLLKLSVPSWHFLEDLGDLRAGEMLTFAAGGNEHGRAYLPLKPAGARVLATDEEGRPALLERAAGQGRIVLSAYPIEYFAASRPRVNPENTYRLYRALALSTGAMPPVWAGTPEVLVDRLVHEEGHEHVWLISEADRPLVVTPAIPEGYAVTDLCLGNAITMPVQLRPFGVRVLRLQ